MKKTEQVRVEEELMTRVRFIANMLYGETATECVGRAIRELIARDYKAALQRAAEKANDLQPPAPEPKKKKKGGK